MNKKIDEIMEIMDTIIYGFKDNNGNNIFDNQEKISKEFSKIYFLQSPSELLKSKCGVCWDQVELERKLFDDRGISTKTYFMFLTQKENLASHTFLTYEDNGRYYLFEHSWNLYKGVHEYSSEVELLDCVKEKFLKVYDGGDSKEQFYLYQYEKPDYHISCDEFYKYIETQKRIDF